MIYITEEQLVICYEDGTTIEISLDQSLYPGAIEHIALIKELRLEDPVKFGSDIFRLRKIIWSVVSMIQIRLNSMASRDLEYAPLEERYKDYLRVSAFVIYFIRQLDALFTVNTVTVPNPMIDSIVLN